MRFRIGDRELELELLTFRLRRLQSPRQQPNNQPNEDKNVEEKSDDILELTF